MIHLKSISLKPSVTGTDVYPFNLPLVRQFGLLEFRTPVTFLVGENGSGKSTLLEGIAAGIGSITVGGDDVDRDNSLSAARKLGRSLKFSWAHKTRSGFFLRAEDFFGFTKRMQRSIDELKEIADGFDDEYSGHALALAKGSVLGQRRQLVDRYGENPDARSHGEAFLQLFRSRFVPGGIYLLDEPETPLSAQRQLALMSMLKEMVDEKSQFIIATHSPILMAFPEATILSFDTYPVREVAWDEVEHVSLTRSFLNNPAAWLRHL